MRIAYKAGLAFFIPENLVDEYAKKGFHFIEAEKASEPVEAKEPEKPKRNRKRS